MKWLLAFVVVLGCLAFDVSGSGDYCPAVDLIYTSHPCDCNKFLIYEQGTINVWDCPDGLHYNPELVACDWPEQAGCLQEETVERS